VQAFSFAGGDLFAPEMYRTKLYPTKFTDVVTDKGVFKIPCTNIVNGSITNFGSIIECPSGLSPRTDGQLEDYCLFPCPSLVFDEREYTIMWSASLVFGLLAILGNGYMMLSYSMLKMRQITPETKLLNLVSFMGFLWCLVEILPALALGNSVACSCDTELCYHDSIVCSISEQSTFVQQSLFWLLTCYMHDAFLSITKQAPRTEREKMYPVYGIVSLAMPIINLLLTQALTSFETGDPNYHLNAIRSAFSCHPQLPTMVEEVLLLYSSNLLCSALMFGTIFRITRTMFSASQKAHSAKNDRTTSILLKNKKALKTVKRLIGVCLFVLFLFGLYIVVTIYYAGIMAEFGASSDEWKECNEHNQINYPKCSDWVHDVLVRFLGNSTPLHDSD
jgi:hypothetical protein